MAVPSAITDISTTASSNSPAGSDSIGNPGTIDDYFRGYGAVMRAESLNKSWERWNDTPTYISATQFSVTSDKTARYLVGRRVKCTVTAGTVYGYISASAFSTVTTVTVVLDSGSLDSGLSEVQLGTELLGLGSAVTGTGAFVRATNPTLSGLTVSNPSSGILANLGTGARVTSVLDAQAWMASNGWGFNQSAWTRTASTKAVMWGTGNNAGYFEVWSTATGDATTTAPSDTNRKFAITDDGRMFGTALHNNSGAVTGTTNQYVASGTYTPTVSGTSNIDSTTAYVGQWIRVGNVVTVSVRIDVDATVATTATSMQLTLPISSSMSAGPNPFQLIGTLFSNGNAGSISAPAAGGSGAVCLWTCASAASAFPVYCHFTYVIA